MSHLLTIIELNRKMKSEIGTVTKWNDEKGFGFITPKSGGKQIFIHVNEFSRRHKRPSEGLSVNFDRTTDSRGRNCAMNVYPLKGHRKTTTADSQLKFSIFFTSIFIAIVGLLAAVDKLPLVLPGFYIILSVVAFNRG